MKYDVTTYDPNSMKNFMQEWSRSKAEAEHVETLEEANDFNIPGAKEDDDFFQNLTVYEMHEVQEDYLAAIQAEKEAQQVESNETSQSGAVPQTPHDQSAPIENSPAETPSLSSQANSNSPK